MAKITQYDAGNLALRPSETGVESVAGAARRVGTFYNQQSGAEQMLAAETDRLASNTQQLGRETQQVGSETAALGSEKGAALASVGRELGSGIAAAGDAAVSYETHQNISHGTAAWSNILQQTTQDWNDTLKGADPNDPTVAQSFMSRLREKLDNFKENGFYTEDSQKWADAHTAALEQHFAEKTMGDMSSLAGEAIKVNHAQTVNSLSATVHGDPSSLDFALAGLKSSAEGIISTSPNLRGTDVAKVRGELQQAGAEAIVKSAAIGEIEKTGKMPAWVTDPKYSGYVNGAELKMFEKQAQVQARADSAAARQDAILKKQQADLAVHAGSNKVFSDNVSIGPDGRPMIDPKFYKQTLDLARNNPDAPSAASTARTMLDWGESQQNKDRKPVDDPTTVKGLNDRLFSPDNPTTAIDLMRAHAQGKISDHTFTSLNGMVKELDATPMKGPVFQDTMKAVHSTLNLVGQNGFTDQKDPIGERNYAKFIQTFVPEYVKQSRAGTLPANALDLNDPKSLISQSMAPFRNRSMQGDLQTQAETPPPAKASTPEVPTSLRGIAALSHNKDWSRFRDDATGKIYDNQGAEIGK